MHTLSALYDVLLSGVEGPDEQSVIGSPARAGKDTFSFFIPSGVLTKRH